MVLQRASTDCCKTAIWSFSCLYSLSSHRVSQWSFGTDGCGRVRRVLKVATVGAAVGRVDAFEHQLGAAFAGTFAIALDLSAFAFVAASEVLSRAGVAIGCGMNSPLTKLWRYNDCASSCRRQTHSDLCAWFRVLLRRSHRPRRLGDSFLRRGRAPWRFGDEKKERGMLRGHEASALRVRATPGLADKARHASTQKSDMMRYRAKTKTI